MPSGTTLLTEEEGSSAFKKPFVIVVVYGYRGLYVDPLVSTSIIYVV